MPPARYLLLVLSLPSLLFSQFIDAAPTAQARDQPQWVAITRSVGRPDSIVFSCAEAATAEEQCQKAYGAERMNNTELVSAMAPNSECAACKCPDKRPAYIVPAKKGEPGKCVDKLESACAKPVLFKAVKDERFRDSQSLPLIPFPTTPTEVLAPGLRVLWKESAIKMKAKVGARCNLTAVFFMREELKWQKGDVSWFRLGWEQNEARIFWNLTTSISEDQELNENSLASQLLKGGSIVRINLSCSKGQAGTTQHCLSFRLAGKLVNAMNVDGNTHSSVEAIDEISAQPQGRLETILIILLTILLFLSIFGSIVLWNVCWRMKKNELISSLQMQFLYHIKQEKVAALEAQQRFHAMAAKAMSNGGRFVGYSSSNYSSQSMEHGGKASGNEDSDSCIYGGEDMGQIQSGMLGGGAGAPKRKLYFSAEFFEPHFMANPPPMAEQFLFDLRKMIGIAKQRIRIRRHTPQLAIIVEDENEGRFKEDEDELNSIEDGGGNSPKSCKSIGMDSGRDTMADASSSDSSAASLTPPLTPPTAKKGVKQLVKGFENSALNMETTPNTQTDLHLTIPTTSHHNKTTPPLKESLSRIPISKSPKLAMKGLSLASSAATSLTVPTPSLPPRNMANGMPLLPPSTPPPPPPVLYDTDSDGTYGRSRKGRKTYAVFPSDSMLKKSLPRRSKKAATAQRTTAGENRQATGHGRATTTKSISGIVETRM